MSSRLSQPSDLDKRLDEIGWGIFLTMIGAIWLVPSVPRGTWLVGTGVLLLVLNLVRYTRGLRWSGFTSLLGLIALAAGLSEMLGMNLPIFAICLVAIGLSMVLKPYLTRPTVLP